MSDLGNKKIMARNIQKYMDINHVTRNDLCAAIGVKYTTLTDWIKGNTYPRIDWIEKMAKYFGIRKSDLVEDSDHNALSDTPHPDLRPVTTKQYNVLGSVACGEPIFMAEQMDVTVDAENIPAADYVLTAKGDSMINIGIHDGDLVFVHSQPMVENGQVAVVAIGDEATLKRFYYYQEKDLMILKPENPACRDIIKTGKELEDVRVLGRAVKFLTDVR